MPPSPPFIPLVLFNRLPISVPLLLVLLVEVLFPVAEALPEVAPDVWFWLD